MIDHRIFGKDRGQRMRRIVRVFLIFIFAVLVTLTACAETADEPAEGSPAIEPVMQVVDCENWVSLREKPDTRADRLAKVPLGAVVENCAEGGNGFIRCTYCGMDGYILSGYLGHYISEGILYGADAMRMKEVTGDSAVLEWKSGGYRAAAGIRYENGKEVLYAGYYAEDGTPVWSRAFIGEEGSQFRSVDCFIGGAMQEPCLLVYSPKGLTAIELLSGTDLWTLEAEVCRLGAGIVRLVDPNGNIYITGYDGPPPVCVDSSGNVLWKSELFNDEIYWPYSMSTLPDGLHVLYESPCAEDPDSHYDVCFNLTTGEMEYYDIVKKQPYEGTVEIIR